MEVLSLLKKYGNGFEVVEDGKMDPKDRQNIKSAEFVNSEFGTSVCLHLYRGGIAYIPLDKDCPLTTKDTPNLDKAHVKALKQEGKSEMIFRYYEAD
jgi:hypothetical protein